MECGLVMTTLLNKGVWALKITFCFIEVCLELQIEMGVGGGDELSG